jgi:hypothetical protein
MHDLLRERPLIGRTAPKKCLQVIVLRVKWTSRAMS